MKVLVVEDEKSAAKRVISLLEEINPEIDVLQVIDTVKKTVEWFQTNSMPDILFLDIQLADGLCFEIFNKVEVECPVIFTTAYDQYALKAFEVYSLDYLLKPIDREKLIRAIDWAGIQKIKENCHADSAILFAEEFISKDLLDRASEEGVQLYEVHLLKSIIDEHQKLPFSLFELRVAFSPLHHPRNNLSKLWEMRNSQWQNWHLIKEIIQILKEASKSSACMDHNLLLQQLDEVKKSDGEEKADPLQVRKIVELLCQEPLKLVECTETGNIILAYPGFLGKKKLDSLLQYLFNMSKQIQQARNSDENTHNRETNAS